ncbi:MAG: nitronate monooxygenase, partial [Chlorobi bacterium]|nr:nitronate monooxygenase [Chlorobiota bacterium]
LRRHIRDCRAETKQPFGVNLPLMRADVEELVDVILDEGVRIVFTSAGHPGRFAKRFRDAGCVVAHVVPALKFALKARDAGCDVVVAEGFEAGGHDGVDEVTTMCLVPEIVDALDIPVIAAGGIADGRGMAAVFALGAEGAQIGTRFAATLESSASEEYKRRVVEARGGDTILTLKSVTPVRMLKNPFALKAREAELAGATREEQAALLGSKRERKGIFEGDWEEGMFEAGQGVALIREILPAAEVVRRLVEEYALAVRSLPRVEEANDANEEKK